MGFGSFRGKFWYGLRALHCLTSQGDWEMRMDIKLDILSVLRMSISKECIIEHMLILSNIPHTQQVTSFHHMY